LILRFLGSAGEVGRSCIMVESRDTRVLLDCGVKLGGIRTGGKEEHPMIEKDELRGVDAIILSHAHLDHTGFLPHVYSSGWDGNTYALKPTMDLANVLISDYIRISNPEGIRKEGIQKVQKNARPIEYHKDFTVKDFKIRFLPAGHILGSAMIQITDGRDRLVYTGDVNTRDTKILDAAYLDNINASTLITESTYGGNEDIFPSEKKIAHDMAVSMKETINAGGKVVVPSFAVGRAQEVLFILDDFIESGFMPKVPIHIDGMITRAMKIHRHNVIYCREELQKRILMSDNDPFKSRNFYEVKSRQARNKLMGSDEACIIVTTSGMVTGGPIMKYLPRLGGDALNKLILVGYQAEGTRGRELEEGAREVEIDGSKVGIRMTVEKYHLSAHADRDQLISIMHKIDGLKDVFMVHGELKKSEQLRDSVKDRYNARVPKIREDVQL